MWKRDVRPGNLEMRVQGQLVLGRAESRRADYGLQAASLGAHTSTRYDTACRLTMTHTPALA